MSRPPSRALPALPVMLLASSLLPAPARADTPDIDVLLFEDLDPQADCDPWQARLGACVEEVRLLSSAELLARGDTRAGRALARAVSETSFWLWQDLAWRWEADGSRVAQTLGAGEEATPPTMADQWEAAAWVGHDGRRPRVLGLPETSAWLGADDLFSPLRQVQPPGVPDAPALVLLRGRFAQRLGFDGRAWPYHLMDADPATSGPFEEQLFPYRRSGLTRPLAAFDLPEHLAGLGPDDAEEVALAVGEGLLREGEGDIDELLGRAHGAFEHFARTTGVQLLQFSMEDYTRNHLRVLAALTAMRLPPGALDDRTGLSRDLVAAALGETDASEALLARVDQGQLALPGGFPLRLEQLPPVVAWDWLQRLQQADPALSEAAFAGEVDQGGRALLGPLLRPDAPALTSVTPDGLRDWVARSVRPGADRQQVQDEVVRLALARALDRLPQQDRHRVETWVLLDHVATAIAGDLDPDPALRVPPALVTQTAEAGWRRVLSRHGRTSRPIDQGLGAVDATAICTTRDGQDALSEPSFGAVRVDLLVDAAEGATDPLAVLWERRDALPWLAIDDPETTRPTLTRLVGLPGGRALYRVRWTLWSGWHLAWDSQPLPTGQRRLAARSTAICSDMVLTPPELAATVLRAGLLEGELLPAVPARRGDRPRGAAPSGEPVSNDEALAAGRGATDRATAVGAEGEAAASTLTEAPTPESAQELASGVSLDGSGPVALGAGPVSSHAAWLQALARTPIDARHGEGADGVLLVLDATAAEPDLPGARARRTPYLRVQGAAGGGTRVQVAGHLRHLDGPEGRDMPLLAPSWRPKESVRSPTELPRWRASSGLDFDLGLGLGVFPWREVRAACATQAGDLSTVAPCPDEDTRTRSEGVSVDLGGGLSLWPGLRPRLGVEAGLLGLLDVVHAGPPLLWPESDGATTGEVADATPAYTWTLRPQGGLYTGLRWQPRPTRLHGAGRAATWGAEAADGRARLARTEGWLRGGFTAGPGFNGLEGTVLGELGLGRSVVRRRGRMASLAPYHPASLFAGFVRYQLGFTLLPDADQDRLLSLRESHALVFGLRTRLRLHGRGPTPQELAP